MHTQNRSGCPINLTLEILGDKWSLIVIRDIMFGDRRRFRQLLTQSEEGIASNILAVRLKRLVDEEFLIRTNDPTHKQKGIYSLTEKAIQLVPVFAAIGIWGRRHLPVGEEHDIRMRVFERGGTDTWQDFMDELRQSHLSVAAPPGRLPALADKMQKTAAAAMLRKRKRLKRSADRV
ncbi:MAG TPA: helix-turn-helix domain-containing protein [Steroidobacteraceae bacterium]